MRFVKVTGISEKNTESSITYVVHEEDTLKAIEGALYSANEEYTCEYDADFKPIANTIYKEFVKIRSVEFVDM